MSIFRAGYKKFIFGIFLTVALSYVLLSRIRLTDLSQALTSFHLRTLVVAVGILLAMNFLKSYRFSRLLHGTVSFRNLSPLVFIHNFYILFMPSRSGELAYPYMLKQKYGLGLGQSLSSLIVARVLDVIIILLLIAGTIIIGFRDQAETITGFFPLMIFGLAVLLAGLFLILYKGQWLYEGVNRHFVRKDIFSKKLFVKIAHKFIEILQAFSQKHSHGTLIQITLITIVIWIITFGFEFVLYRGLGLEISYWQFLVASLFPVLIHIIPVQSLAGIGTYEASIAGGFVLLGFDLDKVIPLTFTVHLTFLIMTAIFGFFAFLFYRRIKPVGI